MSMSELESGSATVGGGRGDAIILTLYVRVGLLGLESAAGVDRLPLS